MEKLLYGVAYYDEYMPYDRLEKDIKMMKAAGINVVRIAESTWSTLEPQSGIFNFIHVDRVLEAMYKADIKVIIGTPTYAVPTWLVKEHPNILAITPSGPNKYGPRQNMDITNPAYLFHAERVIRKLLEHVKDHPAIIGYQADNETKHYNTSGANVQLMFVKYMKEKFPNLEELNHKFGLDYWSNRINSWEDFPSVDATINASLKSEFSKFQRKLVTDFLSWQADIIREYKFDHQFVTQNFDFEWRGYSYGLQPDVDHFEASKTFDVVGCDIYHPSQDNLTGREISLCGDMARSLKSANYLVLETQAQGFINWVPYPGQLRLNAFSHLASGANMVAYWHWHSIHNSFETYWKGLLSQDFEPSPTYEEAKTIGADFSRLSDSLINLKKTNKVAMLASNEALTALGCFSPFLDGLNYNDVLRLFYDALYNQNIGCDFISPSFKDLDKYSLILVPSLYAAPDELLEGLNAYVKNGGHIVYGIKSGFSDENVKVRSSHQPGIINEACGIYYSQFVAAKNVTLKENPFKVSEDKNTINGLIELITPTTAEVLGYYDHPHFGKYAAITKNQYGKGSATYVGCLPSSDIMEKLLEKLLKEINLWLEDQTLHFPIIIKSGVNENCKNIHYYFNYSDNSVQFIYPYGDGLELLDNRDICKNNCISLKGWGLSIIKEN